MLAEVREWKQLECDGCGRLLPGFFFRVAEDEDPEVLCEECLERWEDP